MIFRYLFMGSFALNLMDFEGVDDWSVDSHIYWNIAWLKYYVTCGTYRFLLEYSLGRDAGFTRLPFSANFTSVDRDFFLKECLLFAKWMLIGTSSSPLSEFSQPLESSRGYGSAWNSLYSPLLTSSQDRDNVFLSSPPPTLPVYRAFYCSRRSSWEAAQRRQTSIHKNNIFRVPLITTLGAPCTQARGDGRKILVLVVGIAGETGDRVQGFNEVARHENYSPFD